MTRLLAIALIITFLFIGYSGCAHEREVQSYKKQIGDAKAEALNWEISYKMYMTQYETLNNELDDICQKYGVERTGKQLEAAKK